MRFIYFSRKLEDAADQLFGIPQLDTLLERLDLGLECDDLDCLRVALDLEAVDDVIFLAQFDYLAGGLVRNLSSSLLARRQYCSAVKEFLLNLYRDLIQPFLGPVCPFLVMPDLCLKLSYPVFSSSKLSG